MAARESVARQHSFLQAPVVGLDLRTSDASDTARLVLQYRQFLSLSQCTPQQRAAARSGRRRRKSTRRRRVETLHLEGSSSSEGCGM